MSEYRETYNRVFKGANENFKGNTINETRHEAYKALLTYAEELTKGGGPYGDMNYGFTESTSKSRNAIVYIEADPPASFLAANEKIIAAMAQMADDVVIAVTKNSKIRISFGVRDIWSE